MLTADQCENVRQQECRQEFMFCLHDFLSALVGPEKCLTDPSKDLGEPHNNNTLYRLLSHFW